MSEPYLFRVPGPFRATRHAAALEREAIISRAQPGQPVILDFSDVEGTSWAFADELVCKLALAGHPVRLTGLNEYCQEVAETVVGRRSPPVPAMIEWP